MDSKTYETKDTGAKLETYEWDNVWWEHTEDGVKPRIMYIGDSISAGLRNHAQKKLENQILIDRFGTSKAVDNTYFTESIRLFGVQQGRRNLIIFNNGLHGWHLHDTEEYRIHYEKIVCFLQKEYPGTKIALVLTTSVVGERNERVIARNNVVRKIADKYSLPVIDMYKASIECFSFICDDGVHFKEAGYEKMAERLVKEVYNIIKY